MSLNLSAIKYRVVCATAGPWKAMPPDDDSKRWFIRRLIGVQDVPPENFYICLLLEFGNRLYEDATFIAHARQDIPDLIAEVEKLRYHLNHMISERHKETKFESCRDCVDAKTALQPDKGE